MRNAISLCCLIAVATTAEGEAALGQEAAELVMRDYLELIGRRHDIHFAIEESWAESEVSNRISSTYVVSRDSSHETLAQTLRELETAVPCVSVVRSSTHPKIVYIRDTRLVSLRNYALDQELRDVDFQGKVEELRWHIASRVSNFVKFGMRATSDGMFDDFITPVRVSLKRAIVRDLLSNHLPLPEYSRVLWIASTSLTSPPMTLVLFSGPRQGSMLWPDLPMYSEKRKPLRGADVNGAQRQTGSSVDGPEPAAVNMTQAQAPQEVASGSKGSLSWMLLVLGGVLVVALVALTAWFLARSRAR